MNIVRRFASWCILFLSMLTAATGALAQAWPTKPVTLMVPFAPGGTTDIVARPFAQAFSEEFGQSFVVDNRAGAGGTLAAGIAARAAPDGYTLFVATVALYAGACALLVGVGAFEVIRRYHGEYEPDITPVREAAIADHPRTVLTNTPIVLFYLRSLHPQFDRPSNIGPGHAATCARPCLVIDDSRAYGGTPRQAAGTQTRIGPYLLTLER